MKKVPFQPDNCIIWPPNMSTEDEGGSPCWVHRIESDRLGIGGKYSIQAEARDRVLIVRECVNSVQMSLPQDEDGNPMFHVPPQVTFTLNEVNRRGQFIDLGGYCLDPGPWMFGEEYGP